MVKISHVILIVVLFIFCIWLIVAFTHENTEIDKADLGNSTNINQTIENITGNNVSYNNGQSNNYNLTINGVGWPNFIGQQENIFDF